MSIRLTVLYFLYSLLSTRDGEGMEKDSQNVLLRRIAFASIQLFHINILRMMKPHFAERLLLIPIFAKNLGIDKNDRAIVIRTRQPHCFH